MPATGFRWEQRVRPATVRFTLHPAGPLPITRTSSPDRLNSRKSVNSRETCEGARALILIVCIFYKYDVRFALEQNGFLRSCLNSEIRVEKSRWDRMSSPVLGIFWISNGARPYPRWSGRRINVLGLEEVGRILPSGLRRVGTLERTRPKRLSQICHNQPSHAARRLLHRGSLTCPTQLRPRGLYKNRHHPPASDAPFRFRQGGLLDLDLDFLTQTDRTCL